MKKENITVLRKILYAVESGGQVYGKQNYGAFAGVGANTENEKAITIGAGQWYAEEARTLLLNIQKKYTKEFKKLDTAGIAADLNKSWGTCGVTKTSAKGKCIIAIITSAGGIKCQDALMETQIKTYAASIEKKYGSLSDDAMMECINIIHQGGSGALTRILAKTQKPYTAKTIYAALCTDPADKSNNNQVGDYVTRQKVVYGFITKYCNKEGVNTMGYSRQAVADLVNSWVGKNEADGSYKTIIEIYNSYKGTFPRGTKMDYSWPWCACTWSAAAIKLGYTPIMPIEISCYYLIEAAKKKGIWIENDAHVPKVGEGVLYYWKDGMNFATTDCTGVPDHVGTVTEVYEKAGYFVVTEGNYSNAVKKRTLLINGRYIRGFISPKYTDDTVTPVTPAAGKDLTTVCLLYTSAIGLRTNNGEIQILTGNNAAKNTADLTAGSAEWKAILPDGTLVAPGTAGTLKIDIVSGVPKISTTVKTTSGDQWPSTPFKDLAVESGITIPDILKALAVFPSDNSDHGGDRFYARNDGEKCFFRGGYWCSASDAGVFCLSGRDPRSFSSGHVGFRPAYILL